MLASCGCQPLLRQSSSHQPIPAFPLFNWLTAAARDDWEASRHKREGYLALLCCVNVLDTYEQEQVFQDDSSAAIMNSSYRILSRRVATHDEIQVFVSDCLGLQRVDLGLKIHMMSRGICFMLWLARQPLPTLQVRRRRGRVTIGPVCLDKESQIVCTH